MISSAWRTQGSTNSRAVRVCCQLDCGPSGSIGHYVISCSTQRHVRRHGDVICLLGEHTPEPSFLGTDELGDASFPPQPISAQDSVYIWLLSGKDVQNETTLHPLSPNAERNCHSRPTGCAMESLHVAKEEPRSFALVPTHLKTQAAWLRTSNHHAN